MRQAPTLGYLAVAVVAVLVGACAGEPSASGSGTDASEKPSDETALPERPSAPSRQGPAFEPTFDSSPTTPAPGANVTPSSSSLEQCIDNGDPGSSENVATRLPDTDDCDDDLKTLTGTARGAVDVDFYKLSASDHGISFSHPFGCRKDTDFEAQTAGTELCVYVRCKNSTVDAVTGCESGTMATSDIGMKGCCAAAPGHAVPKWDCSGLTDDDSADFFLRVKQINGDRCLPYTVKYRY